MSLVREKNNTKRRTNEMENKTTMALDELLEMPNVVCAKCGRALAVGSVVFTMVGTVEDFSYCDRDCAGIQNDRDDY